MLQKGKWLLFAFVIFTGMISVNQAFAKDFILSKHSTFSSFDTSGYTSSGQLYVKLFKDDVNNSNVKKAEVQVAKESGQPVISELKWEADLSAFTGSVKLSDFKNGDKLNVALTLEGPNRRKSVKETVSIEMGEDVPVADAGPDMLNKGFGNTVTLDGGQSSGTKLTYKWSISQANDRSVVKLKDNGDGTASFKLPKFGDVATAEPYQPVYDKAKPLAMTYDMIGSYEVKLTVTDDNGKSSSDYVEITATSRTSGLKNVPFGKPVFVVAPEAETYNWVFGSKPAGSNAKINNDKSRVADFTPDLKGEYVINEVESDSSIKFNSGEFVGVGGIAKKRSKMPECSACHKIIHKSWLGTHHSFALENKYNGVLTDGKTPFPFFREFCVKCHTTGFDRAATTVNNGFDDKAAKEGWTFPLPDKDGNVNPQNFDNLLKEFPETASLSQVQCEMCHGPGDKPHVFTNDTIDKTLHPTVCGQCHAYSPSHNRYIEWQSSAHARSVRMGSRFFSGVPAGVNPENPANGCGVHCHTVEGFLRFRTSDREPNPDMYAGRRNDAAPVSCILCHSPMSNFDNRDDAGNTIEDGRKQLRFYGKTTIPKWNDDETEVVNVEVDAGPAAICTKCHLHNMYLKDYSGEAKPEPAPFKVGEGAPSHHQAQMYFGIGGSEYDPDEFGQGAYPAPTHVTAFRKTFDKPKYCVHCHMMRYRSNEEQSGKLGSHTWSMEYKSVDEETGVETVLQNGKPCLDCHEDAMDENAPGGYSFAFAYNGEIFLESLLNQLKNLLPQDSRGRVVWNPKGDDLGTPDDTSDDVPPLSPLQVKAAYNYYFVENDGSHGHHNMDYAARLISDAIRSLGETPVVK